MASISLNHESLQILVAFLHSEGGGQGRVDGAIPTLNEMMDMLESDGSYTNLRMYRAVLILNPKLEAKSEAHKAAVKLETTNTAVESEATNAAISLKGMFTHLETDGVVQFARWRSQFVPMVVLGLCSSLVLAFAYRPSVFPTAPKHCRDILMGVWPLPVTRQTHAPLKIATAIARLLTEYCFDDYKTFSIFSYFHQLNNPVSCPEGVRELDLVDEVIDKQAFGMTRADMLSGHKEQVQLGLAEKAISMVARFARTMDPSYVVVPFGSLVNKLCSATSDLDLAICPSGAFTGNLTHDHLLELCESLQSIWQSELSDEIFVVDAAVPVVRGSISDSNQTLDIEVSFYNMEGPRNTLFLRSISLMDGRFLKHATVVKAWASKFCADQNRRGYLPSIGWALLYAQFRQALHDLDLPSLPEPSTGEEWSRVLLTHLRSPTKWILVPTPDPTKPHPSSSVLNLATFLHWCCREFNLFNSVANVKNSNETFDSLSLGVGIDLARLSRSQWLATDELNWQRVKGETYATRMLTVCDPETKNKLLRITNENALEDTLMHMWCAYHRCHDWLTGHAPDPEAARARFEPEDLAVSVFARHRTLLGV